MKTGRFAAILLAGALSLTVALAGSKDEKVAPTSGKKGVAKGCCMEGKTASREAKHCDDKASSTAACCKEGAKGNKVENKTSGSQNEKGEGENK